MIKQPPNIYPYHLIVGIICGSLQQITPLLQDINLLRRYKFLTKVSLHLLANGVSAQQLTSLVIDTCPDIKESDIHILKTDETKNLTICKARNVLQKSIGQAMEYQPEVIAWLLDDDMRIPETARDYLPWLPSIKQQGVDTMIGCIDGGSPNPPAHGMRVQINDLWHNLNWLAGLDNDALLPDRSKENATFRKQYPDYYYDLSRKHDEHLTKPYWLIGDNLTVSEARQYILKNLDRIFTGEPFLRPLMNELPENPLEAIQPSVNRGGNCFILNHKTLTDTPNLTTQTNGMDDRRSDMIWALINRYYYGFNIMAVNFPTYHHRFVGNGKDYNLQKNIAEVKGAALYASLSNFFINNPNAGWNFTNEQCTHIITQYQYYIEKRLDAYKQNYQAIEELLQRLLAGFSAQYSQIEPFIEHAKKWIDEENLTVIRNNCVENEDALTEFLKTLTKEIMDY